MLAIIRLSLTALRPLTGICALILVGSFLTPDSRAQELLRLPDFPVEQVQPAADEGDAEALYILATVYFKGKRAPYDYRKAAELFTRAAEQGLGLAQLHLAEMYYEGSKVPQNDANALRWYQVAALQGMPSAQYGMGNIYAAGRGTPSDSKQAAYWYEQAAMQGHGLSQTELGLLYATGTGVTMDMPTAYKWLTLAAAQGMLNAATARDEVRNSLTASQIESAQRDAAAFVPVPHYGQSEIKRQTEGIMERAKGLIVTQ